MNNERVIITVPAYEDLIDRVAKFDSFTIAGRVYSSEFLIPQLTLRVSDLVAEASLCSALILYWGLEAARGRRYHAQVSAAYRSWRDHRFLELKQTVIEATGKFPTDSQAEKLYRQDPEYGKWRGNMDDSQEAAEMAEAIYEAFKTKKDMIAAAEKIMKDEAGGAYQVRESVRQSVPRNPQVTPPSV